MTRVHAWRWCAAAGVIAFLCSWGFGQIPGLVACGPSGGLGPILAFEFVRSPPDVAALFGVEPCRSTLVRAQTIGLLIDCLAFIPAYTAFLVCAAHASAPAKAGAQFKANDRLPPAVPGERQMFRMVVAALLIAGMADEIEGVMLYRILSTLPGDQMMIDALWWAVHAKFTLLALGTIAIGVLAVRSNWLMKLLASVVIVGGLLAMRRLFTMPNTGMMAGFTIAWVALLLTALAASIRPSLFAAP